MSKHNFMGVEDTIKCDICGGDMHIQYNGFKCSHCGFWFNENKQDFKPPIENIGLTRQRVMVDLNYAKGVWPVYQGRGWPVKAIEKIITYLREKYKEQGEYIK